MKTKHRIKDLFEVVSGSTPSTTVERYWSSDELGISWITPKDLSKLNSPFITKTERKISIEGLKSCSASLLSKDSVIISSRAPIGYVAVLNDDMSCNQGCKALIAKDRNRVLPLYFFYLLKTKEKELNNLGSGSTFKELSKTKLEEFEVEIHDIDFQNRIASILEAADRARQQRKSANALTEQFLQSSFLHLFGDMHTNEKKWEVVRFKEVVPTISNGWSPVCEESERTSEEEWAVLKLGAVTYGRFNFRQNKRLPENLYSPKCNSAEVKQGDLLFTRKNTRDLVAATAFVFDCPKRLMMSDTIFRLNYNDRVIGVFLWYLLSEKRFRSQIQALASGSAGSMPNISKEKLLEVSLPLPPLSLQQRFASIVADAERLRQKQEESSRELEQLFSALLQKYFGSEPAAYTAMLTEGLPIAAREGVAYAKG